MTFRWLQSGYRIDENGKRIYSFVLQYSNDVRNTWHTIPAVKTASDGEVVMMDRVPELESTKAIW